MKQYKQIKLNKKKNNSVSSPGKEKSLKYDQSIDRLINEVYKEDQS